MKAVVYEKSGSSRQLMVRELKKPIPGAAELLVKIHAVSVNAADYRSMKMGLIPKGGIFGADIAGIVEAAGTDVRSFTIGDRVFADLSGCGFGGFAEYAAVPEKLAAGIPDGVSFEDAAAVPISGVTALQALRDKGKIEQGKKILIAGAGGGVGSFAVQLAKYYGAVVTAVCGLGNTEIMKRLGADRVIDYTKEDFAADGIRYDLILAVNGGRRMADYRRTLASGGICVVVGGSLPQIIKAMIFGPIISGSGKKIRMLAAKSSADDLAFLIGLVSEGKIKPVMDRRYPLDQAADAVAYLEQGHARGKVVLTTDTGV